MKKIGLFLLIFSLAACSKEKGPETPETGKEGNFTLVTSMQEFTKTELCACKEINWKSGDAISVWEKGNALNSNVDFGVIAASVGTSTGKFSGTMTPAGTPFSLYAVYPYSSSYGDDPTSVSLSIPTEISQTSEINDIVGVSDFMVGHSDDTQYDSEAGAYKMLFHHPLAFVKFKIDGRDCVYREATMKSLTMTADVAFVGGVTLNCETGEIVSSETGDGGKTLIINYPNTADLSDVQTAWAAINPVDLTDANCHFVLEMTNGQKVTFTVNPKLLSSQGLYLFEFKDIDAKIAAGKGVPTYVSLLDANYSYARANCYIVSEGGYYKFPAQKVDKTNVFAGSQPYTDGYRANWLWATGTESKVSGVGIGDSGNINFRVEPASNGNSVIVLCDSENKVVWSWHIWCTTEDPLTPTHYGRNDAWLMTDRNLGALSNAQADANSYGLMYQWGRKDPFPGPGVVGSNVSAKESAAWGDKTQNYVFNSELSAVATAFSSVRNSVAGAADGGEIAYSTAHPTTNIHYYANTGTTACTNTWLYNLSQSDALKLWNSTNGRDGKTNYDPCPPGYIVPVTNTYAWYTLWNSNVAWETDSNLSGVVFNAGASNTSYYPAVGFRASGQLNNVGYSSYYWAGNAVVDGTALAGYSLGNYGRTKFSNGQKSQTQWALPVRCMKI
jgi:hypothetical protein